jgi:hypothetical protein
MSEEIKPTEPETVSDEQLEEVSGGLNDTIQTMNCSGALASKIL